MRARQGHLAKLAEAVADDSGRMGGPARAEALRRRPVLEYQRAAAHDPT